MPPSVGEACAYSLPVLLSFSLSACRTRVRKKGRSCSRGRGGGNARPLAFAIDAVREAVGGSIARRRRQKQLLALGAVEFAQEARRQGVARPVVDDEAIAQRQGARTIAQRVLDLMQGNQHGCCLRGSARRGYP